MADDVQKCSSKRGLTATNYASEEGVLIPVIVKFEDTVTVDRAALNS
jgi:hypothetical protein